jgi:hypothetical protein
MSELEDVMEKAKSNLEQFHSLAPVVLCFSVEGTCFPILADFSNESEKYQFYKYIGKHCKNHDFKKIILINDAAFRSMQVEDFEKIKEDPSERPLTYPKSMRTECIVLMYYDLENKKSDILVQPYKEEGDKIIWLDSIPDMKNFNSGLLEVIEEGYAMEEAPA